MNKLPYVAKLVSAAAIYPYSEDLMKRGMRVSRYDDPYQMFKTMGEGVSKRIWVPRNLAPEGSPRDYSTGLNVKFVSSFVPRNAEQSRVVESASRLLLRGESFIVESPTGSGKTVMALEMVARVGKKTLVVVTKEDIKHQWVVAAKKILGLTDTDIGVIQADKFQVSGKKLVIALVQSLSKEDRYPAEGMKEFGLVIYDEVHRVGADHFSQSCYRVPALLRLGLSATPLRKDGREEVVAAHIGPVLVKSVIANMAPKVIVVRSPWVIPKTKIVDSHGYSRIGPIPHSPGKCGHITNMLVNHHARNSMLAKFIQQAYEKGRRVLVQSDRKSHLETLQLMSQNMGVPSGDIAYYTGGMTKSKLEFAKQKKVILSTFAMTAEATDIPWLDTLVMGTPKSDVRQIVGRILRTHPDKKDPVVFDMVDHSSSVFSGYWNTRRAWYHSIGAELVVRD